jgi:hypothetical protein
MSDRVAMINESVLEQAGAPEEVDGSPGAAPPARGQQVRVEEADEQTSAAPAGGAVASAA